MTINSLHLIFEKEETEAYGKECFIMIKYGTNIKTFTKIAKPFSKENISWVEYHEFMKNDDSKFLFCFFHYDEWGNIVCKASGQIKYIVFDETINCHSVNMFDRKNNKYGNLMVKFEEKEAEKVNMKYKLDKRMAEIEEKVDNALEDFNRYKFEAKYNNAVLSEKLREMELKRLEE